MGGSALGSFLQTIGQGLYSVDQKRMEQQQEINAFEKRQRILQQLKDEQEDSDVSTWSYDPENKMQIGYNKKGKKVASRLATGSEILDWGNKMQQQSANLEHTQAQTRLASEQADYVGPSHDLQAMEFNERKRHNMAEEDNQQTLTAIRDRDNKLQEKINRPYYEDARKLYDQISDLLGPGIQNKLTGEYTPIEVDGSGVGNSADNERKNMRERLQELFDVTQSNNATPEEIKKAYQQMMILKSGVLDAHYSLTRRKYSSAIGAPQ